MLFALIVGSWLILTTTEFCAGFAPTIVSLDTVCEMLTTHDDPDPERIVVPGRMTPAASESVWPIAIVPDATAETVRAVPAIAPVKVASGVLADPICREII